MATLLCLTGLSGVGKSAASRHFALRGIPTTYTADVARDLLGEDLPQDRLSYGQRLGPPCNLIAAVVQRALSPVAFNGDIVVVDSLRSPEEWAFVRRCPCASRLIALVCDREIRLQRLQCRDAGNWSRVFPRDALELGRGPERRFNIGALVAMADHYIDTSGDIEMLGRSIDKLLASVRRELPPGRVAQERANQEMSSQMRVNELRGRQETACA